MIILNAISDAKTVPEYFAKTGHKLNLLVSYPYLERNAFKLTKQYRDKIDLLYLDSGAYSVSKGTFNLTVSEYAMFLARYGALFDAYFNLDDKFDDTQHNFNNQTYLESHLPRGAKKPIPVVHDEQEPYEEFKTYAKQGHNYIAIGSSRKIEDKVFKKIRKKFPNVRIHMFGRLNRKMLIKHKPYSADASTWLKQAGFGQFYYWDPEDGADYQIKLEGAEARKGKKVGWNKFHHRRALERFLDEKFGYDRNTLITDVSARWVVNLYFFKQLEDYINSLPV
jgi:hypothetical protein